MLKNIFRSVVAALVMSSMALGSAVQPARADTTTTLLITAAAAIGLMTAVNVAQKNAKANQVVGYLPNGAVVYADGHVVNRNGQSWYPGNYGENIACNGQQCYISGPNGVGYGQNVPPGYGGYPGSGYYGQAGYPQGGYGGYPQSGGYYGGYPQSGGYYGGYPQSGGYYGGGYPQNGGYYGGGGYPLPQPPVRTGTGGNHNRPPVGGPVHNPRWHEKMTPDGSRVNQDRDRDDRGPIRNPAAGQRNDQRSDRHEQGKPPAAR